MKRRLFLVALAPLVAACTKIYNDGEKSRVTPSPSPTPVPVETHEFEYRVNGSVEGPVNFAFADSTNGTTFMSSTLPWFTSFKSNRESLFLSLKVDAFTVGTLVAQIFVDGQLFREAVSDGTDSSISVSGQWNQQ